MNAENKPQLTVPLSADSFSCPKCQTIQENGEQCCACGLIFEKYYRAQERRAAGVVQQDPVSHIPASPRSKRSAGMLVVLVLILIAVGYWQFGKSDGKQGGADGGATLSEKNDPNLAYAYTPFAGTVAITHDRTFMEAGRFDGPTVLDTMDLEQIGAYRKEKIQKYAQLGFFHPGYDPLKAPHAKIYGQITPKTAWVTVVPYYIANPYILLSLTHDGKVAPFTAFLDQVDIVYSNGKITETYTGLNGRIWREFLASDTEKQGIINLTMVNAWDAGFYHAHLVERLCENVVPASAADNIGTTVFSQSSFFHVGQHRKNNISPYDARCRITLKDINSSTRLVFHLWRNKPQSVAAPPDLVYEMSFVP